MSQDKPAPLDIEQITSLAKQFVDRNLFDEAAEFFQIAQRLDPENLGIRLSLAQVRNLQRQRRRSHERDLGATLLEQVRRDAIDAFQFFGLAALYDENGKRDEASQCLEIARSKATVNPYVHKLHGKILFRQHAFDAAGEALRRAQRFNPFDREIVDLLSRVEYERERYAEALEAAIDAFWLQREDDRAQAERLKRRIRTLKTVLKMSQEELVEQFHRQRDKLQTAFDRLEWQRERLLDEREGSGEGPLVPREVDIEAEEQSHGGRIVLATRLRQLSVLEPLDDVEIFQLTQVVRAAELEKGDLLFRHRDDGSDLYVLELGQMAIQRESHYGTVPLGTVAGGTLLGELSFISNAPRSADAVATEHCRLLRFDAQELTRLIDDQPAFGVKIFQCFWHALSRKLRRTNEQLSTFFSGEARPADDSVPGGDGESVDVASRDKIKLLHEQGLTAAELTTLAGFSQVKRFAAEATLFREGDSGQEMYIVLEGRVMISKYIPGGGEEALAILERGDFFGEMSLIDGQPRSADAKAHGGPVTVITFDETTLREVLAMDAEAALQLMQLLCRLIAKRLREIDEKLTTWRIMAGARDLNVTLPVPTTLGGV